MEPLDPWRLQPYARLGPATYDIAVTQTDDPGIIHTTHAPFTVPCPNASITLNPECASPQFAGDPPQTIALAISGTGFQPKYPVVATFDPDGLGSLPPEVSQPTPADGDGNV